MKYLRRRRGRVGRMSLARDEDPQGDDAARPRGAPRLVATRQGKATRRRMGRRRSQESVARRLGLLRPSVSMIESGGRNVTALELMRMAKLYGRSMASLLEGLT